MNLGQLISLVFLASGLILFMLAGMIFRENPRGRLNIIVALMLFFAGIGPLAAAVYRALLEGIPGIPQWFLNSYYIWELFFPALLYFAAIFPEPQPVYLKHKRLFLLVFLPHIFHLLMVLLLADPDKVLGLLSFESSIPILGAILGLILSILKIITAFFGFLLIFHTRFFSLINLFYVIFAIWLLYTGYKRIENPRLRQQVKVVIHGIEMGVGLYSLGFIIPTLFSFDLNDSVRNAMVMLGLVAGPGGISWAIVRYQFLDIGLIARRSLVYSITTAIVIGGYLLIVMQAGSVVEELIGRESGILNVLVVIVLLMFFQPIYSQVDDFIKRIFIRSRGDYSQLVESLSREILTVFQSDRIAATVAEMLKREMFIENVDVCFNEGGRHFRMVTSGSNEPPRELEETIHDHLLARQSPIFAGELSSRIEKSCLGEVISDKGIEVVVPLVGKGKLGGLLLLSGKVAGFRYTYEDMTFLGIMGNQMVTAMENSELYRESLEKQRMEEELAVAKQIQTGLLPRSLPSLINFDFSAFIEPSREVGGDYYDFIPISDGCLGVVIADASGKGVPAALLIARMQAMIQSESRFGKDVDQVMSSINYFISKSTSDDRFATCFYMQMDDRARRIRYCNAGHNYPILVRRNGQVETLCAGGLLLGAFPDASYEAGEIGMEPGDILVLYTDGLTEAMDSHEVEYGEQRLTECILKIKAYSAEAACSMIIKSVKQFSAGISDIDDMTMVVIRARESDDGN